MGNICGFAGEKPRPHLYPLPQGLSLPTFFAQDGSVFIFQVIERVVIISTIKKTVPHPKCLMRKAPRKQSSVCTSRLRGSSTEPAAWAITEFAHAKLPDHRHLHRLQIMATAFANRPTAPIPQACPNPGEAKGTYRFLENNRIAPMSIRQAHHEATLERVLSHPVVLAVQDTTMLNYSSHPKTQGLGPLGSHPTKLIGLLVHSTLAITPAGQPLGFLHNAVRARQGHGLAARRHQRKLAQKESHKWIESLKACQSLAPRCPKTRLVNITDREGDIYELFVQAASAPAQSKVDLLVRARHDRKLQDQDRPLWEHVGRQPVGATLSVLVGRRGDQPGRLAKLNIRFCSVELKAPSRQADQPPIKLWAIQAQECSPVPKGAVRIGWRLLTSCPVTTAPEAIEKVKWYAQRWQIEVIHKVLKSGCQIEQRQLETAEHLERVLSLDLVVAWRILALCKAARQTPDDPISNWLPSAQWQALCAYVYRRTQTPTAVPSVRQAVRWIAQLGGFLARKSDGEPGTTGSSGMRSRCVPSGAKWIDGESAQLP